MKKVLSLLIAFLFSISITNAQFARATATGYYSDTVKVCSSNTIALVAKLSKSTYFNLNSGRPSGFAKPNFSNSSQLPDTSSNNAVFTDSICDHPTPISQNVVCWFNAISLGHQNLSMDSLLYYHNISNIYKIDFDMKFAGVLDTNCSPFKSHTNGTTIYNYNIFVDFGTYGGTSTTTSDYKINVATSNLTGIGSQYNWSRYSAFSKNEVDKVYIRSAKSSSAGGLTGNWGVDNLEIFYNIPYDSINWTCKDINGAQFFSVNCDTNILLPNGSYYCISTIYYGGVSYKDTLNVIVVTLPIPTANIIGDDHVCWPSTETYVVQSMNATSYLWSVPNNQWITGYSSVDNDTINITFWSGGPFVNQKVIVTASNVCGSTKDTIIISSYVIYNPTICYVDFDNLTNKNKIYWSKSPNIQADSVIICKLVSGTPSTGIYNIISVCKYSDGKFVDFLSNPQQQSYTYKLYGKNVCGKEGNYSTYHTTITLVVSYTQSQNTYGFSWSNYVGLFANYYYIYGIDGNNNHIQIDSIPFSSTFYNYIPKPLDPVFIKYYISFDASVCGGFKSTYKVKSNYVNNVAFDINEFNINNFNIYPNPVKDKLNIDLPYNKNIKYDIYNSIGKLILSGYCENKTVINTTDLSPGVYLIRIGEITKKFIK